MTSEDIKEAYSMSDVLLKYGFRVGHNGFCKCMLHDGDRTASLRVYPKSYYCYGCGKGGDIFNWVMEYLHCDFKTAFYELGGGYPKTLREQRAQAQRIEEIEKRKRERAKDQVEAKKAKEIICYAISCINKYLDKCEVFSTAWCNLTNEKAMLHDALMQLAEGRTLKNGVFAPEVRRYIED